MLTHYSPLCAFLIARSHLASSFLTIDFQPLTWRFYRLLIIVCSALFVESPLLFAGNCLPFTVYCSMSTDDRLQVAVCCLLTVV